ncbi:MAG TPA: hypothetical protein VGR73_06490 [Bryobacteraceae bacterium]|nr:hypothetical protein [Bryobacteraceae bacterium]
MTPLESIAAAGPATPSAAATPKKRRQMESVLQQRWARLLIPSLSDLFFVAILCWLFMGAFGWTALLADGDVGWHIRSGEYILNHRAVPHQDLYSFSKPGAPWYAWEWLSDVTDAALYRSAGLKGVVLAAGVLIALFSTTLIRRITRQGVNLFAAMIVALLGVGSASMHFLARPHVFTLVLLSFSMWLVETDRDGSAPRRRIFWLIPVVMVWTNLHGGFLAIVAVLGLTSIGSAVEQWLADRDWSKPIRYGILAVACGAVSLVNPYGWGLHRHIVEYLRSDWIRTVIQEFQSPSFRSENMLQFEGLLFAGLIAAGALLRRRRIAEGLWILLFAYLALSSVRHVPVFVAVTMPLIAGEVASWWQALTAGAPKHSLRGILNQMAADSAPQFRRTSLWPAAFVVSLVAIGQPIKWPVDFPRQLFPVAMVHAHESEIAQARVLTTDQWGDYLIYLHPERQKVFVDGRSDFYGPEVGNEYIRLVNGGWDWDRLMNKYGFNLALLPVELPVVQLLKLRREWRVVEDDGKHILLVLRGTPVPGTAKSIP